jgi:WD40 repeat protein
MNTHRNFKRILLFLLTLVLLGLMLSPTASQAQSDQVAQVLSVAWNHEGSRLAVTTLDSLQIYDQNLQLAQEMGLNGRTVATVKWSPDGTRLIVGRHILDAETLSVLVTIDTEVNLSGWSQDSSQVFTLAADSMGLAIFDATSGNLIKTVSSGGTIIDGAVWSPDNTRFATRLGLDSIAILDVASGGISATYPQPVSPGPLVWSPDSTRIAGATQVLVETGTPGSVPSANSALLFEVYVWDATTGQVLNRFSGLPEYPHALRWHPDGVELAGGAVNGAVFVWDTSTNQQVDYFLGSGPVTRIEYSPLGGRLAIGTNPAQLAYISLDRRTETSARPYIQHVPGIGLDIIVPTPSLERLRGIGERCNAPQNVMRMLNTPEQLPTFVSQVRALTAAQIPPGCAADLIAVAEALQTTP